MNKKISDKWAGKREKSRIRAGKALTLLKSGLPYWKIGEAIGLSGERIRQLLFIYHPEEQKEIGQERKKKILKSFVCHRVGCGNSFFRPAAPSYHIPKTACCSERCRQIELEARKELKKTEEYILAKRKKNAKRSNIYYHKHLKTRADFSELIRKRNKKYQKKIKNDPKRREKHREDMRKRYWRVRNDPKKWAIYLGKMRVYYRGHKRTYTAAQIKLRRKWSLDYYYKNRNAILKKRRLKNLASSKKG